MSIKVNQVSNKNGGLVHFLRADMKKIYFGILAMLFLSCVYCSSMWSQEETDTGDSDREKAWIETITKGKAYLDAKDYDKAIMYFENAAIQFPDVVDLPYYIGYVYYKKDDLDNAEKNFLKVIEAEPAHPEAYYFLSVIAYRRGDKTKAITYLDKVTEIDKNFQNAYFNKGIAYYDLGMYEKSVKEFAYALYLRPVDAASLRGLMRSYVSLFGTNAAQAGQGAAAGDYSSLNMDAGAAQFGTPVWSTEKREPSGDGPDLKNEILILVNGEHRTLISTKEEPVEIKASKGTKGTFEIKFPTSANMTGKGIMFEARNLSGSCKLEYTISDSSTKRTPPVAFNMMNFGDAWKIFTVDIATAAAGDLDVSSVDKIKFELSATNEDAAILVRNIEVK